MASKIKPIPDGFHSITPYLIVKGAAQAIEFYQKAFGAKERFRLPGPGGKTIGHAEIQIGDSIIMLADEFPQMGHRSPKSLKGTPVSLLFYVKDVDTAFERAIKAGGKVDQPVEDKFYGERAGSIIDPFGHLWTLMTHIEDVTTDEVMRRMAKFAAPAPSSKKGRKPPAK